MEDFKAFSYTFGGKKVTLKFKYVYEGKEKVDNIETNRVYIVLEMPESGEKIVCRAWIDSKCEIVKANVCYIYYGVVSQNLTGKQAITAAKGVVRGIAQYTVYCKSVGMLGIVFSDEGAIIPSQLQEKYDVKATKVTLTISGKTYNGYRIEIKGKEGPLMEDVGKIVFTVIKVKENVWLLIDYTAYKTGGEIKAKIEIKELELK